jgi:hypothetical protein
MAFCSSIRCLQIRHNYKDHHLAALDVSRHCLPDSVGDFSLSVGDTVEHPAKPTNQSVVNDDESF